jgi:CDP-diacylglycerol--glycerol-3-phosphate 3-phosphatidyltransferase
MVSYARARAEGLGHNLRGGIFERAERLLLVALGLLLTPWERLVGLAPGGMLLWTLAILAAGANLTAADRILRGRRTLSREQK